MTRGSRRLWQLERHFFRLRSDTRAVAATEFAMILPFMLLLLIGMSEVTGAMNADRKVSRIANSVTDLVAQAQTVTTTELLAVMDLGEKIMAPYPATDLVTTIASVSFDEDSKASVDWSYDSTGSAPWTKGAKPPITIPANIAKANTSIVVGKVDLAYTPPFSGVFLDFFSRDGQISLADTYYLRPRLTDTVDCTNCPSG